MKWKGHSVRLKCAPNQAWDLRNYECNPVCLKFTLGLTTFGRLPLICLSLYMTSANFSFSVTTDFTIRACNAFDTGTRTYRRKGVIAILFAIEECYPGVGLSMRDKFSLGSCSQTRSSSGTSMQQEQMHVREL
jgi:hypothetical protein